MSRLGKGALNYAQNEEEEELILIVYMRCVARGEIGQVKLDFRRAEPDLL